MAVFEIDDQIEGVTLVTNDSIGVKLQYKGNKVALGRGSETVEKLHDCLAKFAKEEPGMEVKLQGGTVSGSYSIKILCDPSMNDYAQREAIVIGMVQKSFKAGLDTDKLNTNPPALPATLTPTNGPVDAAKMERAFDAALDMGEETMKGMHAVRLATFFYNSTSIPESQWRNAAMKFLQENNYLKGNHADNQIVVDTMVDVAAGFAASEQMRIQR